MNKFLAEWRKRFIMAKTFYNDETNQRTDLTDLHIWWNTFFVQMEAGLMKIVCCLNRSWAHDSYFTLCMPTVWERKCPDAVAWETWGLKNLEKHSSGVDGSLSRWFIVWAYGNFESASTNYLATVNSAAFKQSEFWFIKNAIFKLCVAPFSSAPEASIP